MDVVSHGTGKSYRMSESTCGVYHRSSGTGLRSETSIKLFSAAERWGNKNSVCENFVNGKYKLLREAGLDDIAHRSGRKRRPDEIWIIMERQENYLYRTTGIAKFLSCLDATQDGHAYVDDQDVRFQLGGGAE